MSEEETTPQEDLTGMIAGLLQRIEAASTLEELAHAINSATIIGSWLKVEAHVLPSDSIEGKLTAAVMDHGFNEVLDAFFPKYAKLVAVQLMKISDAAKAYGRNEWQRKLERAANELQ